MKEIEDNIKRMMEFAEKKEIIPLPPISRELWSKLPPAIRFILESKHGYGHFCPETDMIESDGFYVPNKRLDLQNGLFKHKV